METKANETKKEEQPKHLRICRFTAENFKKLKVVDITPGPGQNIIQITGKNEAGKSSILDAIWSILEWAEAKKEILKPIREGATSTNATIDLGDIVVSRTWTTSGSYLTVANKEGAIFKSPQAVLDRLKGSLSFDPLEFANMEQKDQMALFMKITGLGEKVAKIDLVKQQDYESRTVVNREIRDLQGEIRAAETKGIKEILDDKTLPEKEEIVSELLEKIGTAQKEIARNKEFREEQERIEEALAESMKEIEQATQALKDAQALLEKLKKDYVNAQAKAASSAADIQKLKDPEIESLMKRANTIDETNRKIRSKAAYLALEDKLKTKQDRVLELETAMEKCDRDKDALYKTTPMPVEGLVAGTDSVLYRGIPFIQCSSAERLRVSTAIAMAQNPNIRVIRITDGSLLDSTNMAEIERLARENDYQIWIEQVDETGKVGIYIEDGEVKEQENDHGTA